MVGYLFVLAITLAGAGLLWRTLQRRRARLTHRVRPGPGLDPMAPHKIRRFDEIDALLAQTRCACGGPLLRHSEGSRQSPAGHVRVVYCECSVCEEEVSLFFSLEELLH
jgi:hypothetical protein